MVDNEAVLASIYCASTVGTRGRVPPRHKGIEVFDASTIDCQFNELQPLSEGSVADITMWFGPLPIRWVARHSDVNPNTGFSDTQVVGPFEAWIHRHSFKVVEDNITEIRDTLPGATQPAPVLGNSQSLHVAQFATLIRLSRLAYTEGCREMNRVVIIGAGFGGLAAAAELAFSGMHVSVLEAHVYPGGSASTFYHQGYHFEAGATLAGGFAPGAPLELVAHRYGIDWGAHQLTKAMVVHMPGGQSITRWTDNEHWKRERLDNFGREAEPFWQWQESTADTLWEYALQLPPWPPQSLGDLASLGQKTYAWMKGLSRQDQLKQIFASAPDAFRPVAAHIPKSLDRLRLFADAQLLISAQATSRSANALYGAAALDLPRQGVGYVPGGMGGMADKLVQAIRRFGGDVYLRQEVTRVSKLGDGKLVVATKQKDTFPADIVIFNLSPWNILLCSNSLLQINYGD